MADKEKPVPPIDEDALDKAETFEEIEFAMGLDEDHQQRDIFPAAPKDDGPPEIRVT